MIVLSKLHPEAVTPTRATDKATGYDLYSIENVTIGIGETALVGTGLQLADIPPYDNLDIQIRSRSGLAAKHQVSVANAPGTIDRDYQGEIKVVLINLGETNYQVNKGDRIAQMVFGVVMHPNIVLLNEAGRPVPTKRGDGGFGSTGD